MPSNTPHAASTRAIGLGLLALVAGCTTLLGVDGDYAADPGGAGGTGGDASSSGEVTSSTAGGGESPATTSTTASVTTTSTASSSDGGGGSGGDGGGSTSTGGEGGGGAGPVDCSTVECADEVLVGETLPDAREPRLISVPGGAVLTYLTGLGFAWMGTTDGNSLVGDYVGAAPVEDVAALDDLDVAVLEGGEVLVPAAGDVPAPPSRELNPLLGGGPFTPPLFAVRTPDDGTIHHVVAEMDRSVFTTCPAGVACAEAATGCEPVQGAVAHALDRLDDLHVLARACGPSRMLRFDREADAPVVAEDVRDVMEVAVGHSRLPGLAFALTLSATGPNRRVTMTRYQNGAVDPYALTDRRLPAHDPALEVDITRATGVWVEVGDDGPAFRTMRCVADTFACDDRPLHVLGPPPTNPRDLTLATVPGGLLLAWVDGDGAATTIRFAMLQ